MVAAVSSGTTLDFSGEMDPGRVAVVADDAAGEPAPGVLDLLNPADRRDLGGNLPFVRGAAGLSVIEDDETVPLREASNASTWSCIFVAHMD